MKERPILFKGPMVRALLNGSKTQTRRAAPISALDIKQRGADMVTWSVSFNKPVKGVISSHSGGKVSELQARSIIASQFCPYGQPGDRLWVREAWRAPASCDPLPPRSISDTEGRRFVADEVIGPDAGFGKSRPSIHMPRWASRVTLEIVSVRVERVQDISHADAMAEGMAWDDAVFDYRVLWEQINGPGSWDANLWVWVVEFKRLPE